MEYKFKIVMVGDFAVGKTSLVQRFVYNTFSDAYLTTIGVKVLKKDIALEGFSLNQTITLIVWDIAGNDSFSFVSADYLRGSSGGIIVCDCMRKDTISSIDKHIELFQKINPGSPYIIALNKADLCEIDLNDNDTIYTILPDSPTVKTAQVILTSALDGRNVETMFAILAKKILEKQ